MGTFRFRSTAVAMALVAGSAVGAQIGTVQPAEAQVPLFVITAAQTTPFDIRAGEKVPLAKIFNVQAVVPGSQIVDVAVAGSEGVLINGVKALGKSSSNGAVHTWDEDAWAFHFPTIQEALSANITAYQVAGIGLRIVARNAPSPDVRAAVGDTDLRFVAPPGIPAQAIEIVASASPPSINGGEKVPLGRFLTTNVFFGPPQITSITFQASGGAQLNGSSSGELPKALGALAAASVTASSDGGITIFINYSAVPPGGGIVPQPFQTQGSVLVRFVAPATPTPTPVTVAATVAPPPAGGAPPVGGGNRAPVAQSVQLIVATGAVTPLVLPATDPDGNALTFVVVQFPAHGKLSGQAPNLSYTPDSKFLGTDALVFTATDGTATSAQATVTITVTGKAVSGAKTVRKVVKKTVKKTTKKR